MDETRLSGGVSKDISVLSSEPSADEEQPRRGRKSTRSSTVSIRSGDSPVRTPSSHSLSRLWSRATIASGRSGDDGEDSADAVSFRKRRKSKYMKGEILQMPDARDPLPMHYFEIDESMKLTKSEPAKPSFGFTRSARKSILLGLGLAGEASIGVSETGETTSELIDPYTKANDRTCMENYMGVVIGYGVFSLPSVFSDCGWVLGLLAICVFGGLNTFWVCRLIQVPMLLRRNLEKYGDVARICFPNRLIQGVAILFISVSWYAQVILSYYNILYYTWHHRVQRESAVWGIVMQIGLVCILLPLTFRTSVKDLTKNVRIGLRAMWAHFVVVFICCIVRGSMNFKDNQYTRINYEPPKLVRGLQSVCVAFTGIGILPYVVSEMLHPDNARKVMTEASWKVTIFFVVYASMGYFGWGDLVDISIVKSIERENSAYAYAAIFIDATIIVRCIACYPIFFLPLFREMEGYLQLEDSPPVSLGLPWAILRQTRLKNWMKFVVIGSSFLVYRCCPHYHFFLNVTNIPNFVAQLILPSVFSLIAVRIYNSHFAAYKDERDTTVFGTCCWQVCVTMTLAAVSFGFGMFLMIGNIDKLVHALRYGMSVYKVK